MPCRSLRCRPGGLLPSPGLALPDVPFPNGGFCRLRDQRWLSVSLAPHFQEHHCISLRLRAASAKIPALGFSTNGETPAAEPSNKRAFLLSPAPACFAFAGMDFRLDECS